jgi:hypothetical protein
MSPTTPTTPTTINALKDGKAPHQLEHPAYRAAKMSFRRNSVGVMVISIMGLMRKIKL